MKIDIGVDLKCFGKFAIHVFSRSREVKHDRKTVFFFLN